MQPRPLNTKGGVDFLHKKDKIFKCGRDEIGKHVGFRILCRKACGFESHRPHMF